jgi:hypothetical protein
VPRVAGVGHFPGRDLQRGEQRGGAAPNVVVGLLLRDPRPNGQDRRGPVQRLDLALLIDAQHDRRLGRVEVEPDDVADLGPQFRVGGELERLRPPRLQPHFCHVVDTVRSLTPRCFASSRDDQCVTPSRSGGGSNVASTIRIGSIDSGRPDFARSSKPAMPSAA